MFDKFLLATILSNLPICDIIRAKQVCTRFKTIIESDWFVFHHARINKREKLNHMTIFLELRGRPCMASYLSSNINLTWNYIIKYLVDPNCEHDDDDCDCYTWAWDELTANKCITFDKIIQNQKLPWRYDRLGFNPNITFEIIQNNPQMEWNWASISGNHNITENIIRQNPNENWCINWLCSNPNISFEFLQTLSNFDMDRVIWFHLSSNPMTTIKTIEDNIYFPWDWGGVSQNKNITINFVLKYINQDWDWDRLTVNPNMTIEIIENNPQMNWNNKKISGNPNVTFEYVIENKRGNWSWDIEGLCGNPNFGWKDLIYVMVHSEEFQLIDRYGKSIDEYHIDDLFFSRICKKYKPFAF